MTYCIGVQVDDGFHHPYNLSVGMPLDLAIVRRDARQISLHRSIGADDSYFKIIRDGWGESLRNAFHALPDPPIP